MALMNTFVQEIKLYGTSTSKRSDLKLYDTKYAEDSNDEQLLVPVYFYDVLNLEKHFRL